MEPSRYLVVNVYPSPAGWRLAVLIREPGRPWPRLVRTLQVQDLPPETSGLRGALEAASQALLDAAADLPH